MLSARVGPANRSADFSPPDAVAACGRRNELRAPPCSARVSDRANRSADFSPPRAVAACGRRNELRAPPCSARVSDALIGARTSVRPARWRHVDGGMNCALRRVQRACRIAPIGARTSVRLGAVAACGRGGINSALRRARGGCRTRLSERGLQSARRGGGMWEGGMNSALLSRC